jgi:hypothetical protein
MIKIVSFALLCLGATASKRRYDGHQVLRCHAPTPKALEGVKNLSDDFGAVSTLGVSRDKRLQERGALCGLSFCVGRRRRKGSGSDRGLRLRGVTVGWLTDTGVVPLCCHPFAKLDFWTEPRQIGGPIDIRAPASSIETLREFLSGMGVTCRVMIE